MTVDVDDLIKQMPLEERIYRFRCVEAWAMVVPWIGFPMKALLEKVQPKAEAKYVRMLTFLDADMAPQQRDPYLPWPYFEGLTLAEAMNDLTLLTAGIYGHIFTTTARCTYPAHRALEVRVQKYQIHCQHRVDGQEAAHFLEHACTEGVRL